MIEGDERELLAATLAQAADAVSGDDGGDLDEPLDEIGWREALGADARTAVSLLFELQGRTNTTSTALDAVLVDALGGDAASTEVAVALPPIGTGDPPGRSTPGGLVLAGLATSAVSRAPVTWVAHDGDGASVLAVSSDLLTRRPVSGLDPALSLTAVTASAASGEPVDVAEAWDEALAAGRRALAHELAGASRTMLQLARDHAVERIQFGQPIAGFQAVRHRLAEALVAVEAAEAAADAAWEDGSILAAAVAKAVAGRNARTVAHHAQQVLAGIGFTTEHPLHRYVRRVLVLDGLLGDTRSLTRSIGEELLASRRVPPLLAL